MSTLQSWILFDVLMASRCLVPQKLAYEPLESCHAVLMQSGYWHTGMSADDRVSTLMSVWFTTEVEVLKRADQDGEDS